MKRLFAIVLALLLVASAALAETEIVFHTDPTTPGTDAGKLLENIGDFSDTVDAIVESLEVKRGDRHTQILDAVKNYLTENFQRSDCCMASAAAVVGMSPAYVGRLYKRYMTKSIAESIQEMRLNSAKRMLTQNRRMTVKQVANANGYDDVSYFCKVFKRYLGITPNEYRNNQKS